MGDVYEPLQRYVRRRAPADDVDDAVAETLATLWRRIDDVPESAVLPWAYAVARRQLSNQRRAAGRRLRLVQRTAAEPVHLASNDHPLDAELETALDSLSASDRELLRLWAWEQLDPAELAMATGLTANAVAIRLHRARRKLAENLAVARKLSGPTGHSHRVNSKEDGP